MKAISIAGNVGKDATTRTAGDRTVTGFRVAVDDGRGDKKRTIWFDCSIWGPRGEKLAGMLTKGTKVAVTGDLSTREHEGKTYLTVNVSEVTLMGGGERREPEARRRDPEPHRGGGPSFDDDQIPFAAEFR